MEQNADDPTRYDVVKTETLDGTTGDPVKVTLIEHNEGEFETGVYDTSLTIDGAGTTVVEVTYDRCEYTLTYDLNAEGDDTAKFADGSTTPKTETVLFGATLDLLGSGDVLRTNYTNTKGVGLFKFLPGNSSIMNLKLNNFNVSDGDITEADYYSYNQINGVGLLANDVLVEREDDDWNHDYIAGNVTVSNVTVTDSYIESTTTMNAGGSKKVGVLVGYCADANITSCEIGYMHIDSTTYAGALLGHVTGTANIQDCTHEVYRYNPYTQVDDRLEAIGFPKSE